MTITVEFFAPPGQSLTLLVCEYGTYTPANGAGDAATETARAGVYTAEIAEALAGYHTAHIVAAAGWELPIGDVMLVDGETCRVRDTGQTGDSYAYLADNLGAHGVEATEAGGTGDQLTAVLAAIAALEGAGGAYTQTVTVTASAVPVPNARVEIWSGSVLIDTKTTNSSGIAAPTCDAGSYTLRVTAAGYASSSTAITVTADAARAVALTALATVPAASDPSQTTAYWYAYTNAGALVGASDVTLTIEMVDEPSDNGVAYDDTPLSVSSNASGLISATLFKGGKYKVTLSDGREWTVTVPLSAGSTYKMSPIRVVAT